MLRAVSAGATRPSKPIGEDGPKWATRGMRTPVHSSLGLGGRVELACHGAPINAIEFSREDCQTCQGGGTQVGRRLGKKGCGRPVGVLRAANCPQTFRTQTAAAGA